MKPMLGAVLVGGRSMRMGRDKATLILPDGRRMMDIVAAALREVCGECVLVGGDDGDQAQGIVRVADVRDHAGPLGGIEALLQSNLAREYVVCPCDVPCITEETLCCLAEERSGLATVLRVAGFPHFEPLPARIACSALPVATRLLDAGERSVWRLMESLPATIVEVDARHAAALRNVNTPDELSRL